MQAQMDMSQQPAGGLVTHDDAQGVEAGQHGVGG